MSIDSRLSPIAKIFNLRVQAERCRGRLRHRQLRARLHAELVIDTINDNLAVVVMTA